MAPIPIHITTFHTITIIEMVWFGASWIRTIYSKETVQSQICSHWPQQPLWISTIESFLIYVLFFVLHLILSFILVWLSYILHYIFCKFESRFTFEPLFVYRQDISFLVSINPHYTRLYNFIHRVFLACSVELILLSVFGGFFIGEIQYNKAHACQSFQFLNPN